MKIGIDFDGTVVDNAFPDVGEAAPGSIYWLKRFQDAGAELILFTMRSKGQKEGDVLTPALKFFKKHGIDLDGINEDPEQHSWTESPKANADIYIDDKGFGCPLTDSPSGGKPIVDWDKVGPEVLKIIKKKKSKN